MNYLEIECETLDIVFYKYIQHIFSVNVSYTLGLKSD